MVSLAFGVYCMALGAFKNLQYFGGTPICDHEEHVLRHSLSTQQPLSFSSFTVYLQVRKRQVTKSHHLIKKEVSLLERMNSLFDVTQ